VGYRRVRRQAEAAVYGVAIVVVAGAVGVGLVVACAGRYPAAAITALLVLLAGLGAALWLRKARRDARERRWAELTRSIAPTDWMTGPQFEHWLAALMRRTGFTRVEVRGGAGDLGADVVAVGPSRHRVVVQCKCFRADRAVGSPDVQRFAGTARALHRADIPVIVTTGRFSAPAVTTAARLGIVLIDRAGLAAWAVNGATPAVLITSR
jgi:restriction system protein